ncbi:cytochrome P450 [Glonium stellatum]|uniref:Cytochrome P450 n=1 Tax=Glonium stellatum TaxID=574774 RepID=A0A8E2JRQ4_9PEZI|nr:cytochrome P450 [Glonium stellatum]
MAFFTATYSAVGLVALVSYVLWKAIANLTSPIRSLPGPLSAKLSSKWLLTKDLAGSKATTVHALHQKYGPVVQLSPNEISFSSIESIKDIYGQGTKCIKSPAYDNFGRRGLFQIQDPEEHRQRAKRVSHIFSQASLLNMEPLVQEQISLLISSIEKNSGKQFDALHWLRMTALDVSGEVLLGKSFEALKGNEPPPYIHHLDNAYLVWSLEGLAPWLCKVLSFLPIKGLQEFMGSGNYVYGYGEDAMREYIRHYGREPKRRDLLTKLIAGNPKENIKPLTDAEISVEVSNLIFAATDTTGNTMTYMVYQLCCHPKWQAKVREEIRNSAAKSSNFSFESVQSLPIVNAIIHETLRFNPVVPSGLPRITPPQGCKIGGMFIPGKTIVSAQALTTQRNPDFFPNPDSFNPQRWLSTNGGTPQMKDSMLVWGKGTRTCLGQNMALMELKIMLARVMDKYAVRIRSEKTHGDMLMTDHFTLIPKGQKCELVFEIAN